ncbi:S1/P1 nuclease [Mucilaginibacter sp.]|uniref:S1/P1 nuclease n=1 Tax=Mucilaginibacter sp. TaxID=1882438 RepID=UPI00261CA5F3|nr:S1/P1 nuclease [Mucilaginibacter sp.]MDB4921815.1 nuclease [Mucilaginibacter sp.]
MKQISSKLYAEIDAMKGRSIGDDYYQAHIGIIEERIEKAGIRLAGVLNEVFKGGPVNGAMIPPPAMAQNQGAQTAQQTVCDQVYTTRLIDGSQMTLLSLGGAYPNQKITIMIKGSDRSKFTVAPEEAFKDKKICVTGIVVAYKGKPEIMVTDPKQITVQ